MTKSRGILPPRSYWRDDEVALLASMYPHCHTDDVAAWTEREMKACYAKAKELGLRKTPDYLASVCAGRIQRGKQHPSMIASRFKPGQPAWNKGTKGIMGQHPNCRRTQFKKGRPANESRNYVPLGSHRISKDGYLERKVTDDPSIFPARRWTAVHRLVWEGAHGPIPKNHVVCFKPGMKTAVLDEITVERLECIPRRELARRNHPASRSPDLARLVQLKGAITRQVNRIQREANERTAHQ